MVKILSRGTKVKKPAKIAYIVVGSIMAMLFVYATVMYFVDANPADRSNDLFIMGQCALYMLVAFVPLLLQKLRLEVPDFVYLIFLGFCMAHFVLGEILGFFALFKWWDSAMHTISGMLITLLSFSLISVLNSEKRGEGKVSLAFACVWAFSVAMAIGIIWEIFEFVADSIMGLNMQRAYVSTVEGSRGEPLIGQNALFDTMKDIILDAIGALVVCIWSAIYIKKTNSSIDKLVVIKYCPKTTEIKQEETQNTLE